MADTLVWTMACFTFKLNVCWCDSMWLNDTTPSEESVSHLDSSAGLSASPLFQPQDRQKVDTVEVLVAICLACQSWKPLSDSRTTHSHWEHFDFLARLPGRPGLSPAPRRRERPALSGTSRGAQCADSPGGGQAGAELSDSRRQHSGEWRGRQAVQWCVCVSVRFLLLTDRLWWVN